MNVTPWIVLRDGRVGLIYELPGHREVSLKSLINLSPVLKERAQLLAEAYVQQVGIAGIGAGGKLKPSKQIEALMMSPKFLEALKSFLWIE